MISLAALWWALSVVPSAVASRRALTSRRKETSSKLLSAHAASLGPDLRLFAASFNAGNRVFEGQAPDFDDLVDKLVGGHDVQGSEADIVLLGLQEFQDKGYQFGSFVGGKTLWKGLSQSKQDALRELSKEITDLATPPEEVQASKRALAGQLHAFHTGVVVALKDFQDKYGAQSHDFHKHLADASSVHTLSDNATTEQQTMSAEIKRRMHQYNIARTEDPQTQFQNITAAAGQLALWGNEFPNASVIKDKFAPVHAWADKVLVAIQEVQTKKFPNLLHHEQGQALWSSLRGKIATSRELERQLVSASEAMPSKFKEAVGSLHVSIEEEVKRAEDSVSASLLKDWNKISKDLATLGKDLDDLISDGKLEEKVAMGVKKGATESGQAAHELLAEWDSQSSGTMDKVLSPVDFDLGQTGVQVRMEPQKYDSGWRCAAGVHYDTVLYAYVNPWSTWSIEPEEYESAKCVKHTSPTQRNMGCNIDNNQGMECGKVVNFLVFKVQNENTSLRLCGLNTHMSFAGSAFERMTLIAEAMEETKKAKCDAVVFVGDFNSRLHCEQLGGASSLPAYEMTDGQSSSLNYVLSRFCQEGNCSMSTSNHTDLDELTQMLNLDTVSCFEQRTEGGYWNKKKIWERENMANSVKKTGLREVQLPAFAPTYKVVPPSKAAGAEWGWGVCLNGEPTCFMNPTKKGKHNPAWTDRILVQTKSSYTQTSYTKTKTIEYSRRPISAAFGSDHIPVVAQVVLSHA